MPNKIIIASAGSGKTTTVVKSSCDDASKRTAVITYTKNGREEIIRKTYERNNCVPPHVTIDTWFSFLLRHFVRPYQRCLYRTRVAGIHFIAGRSPYRIPERATRPHFFSNPRLIYNDKISKFACRTIEITDGLPLQRFEQIFSRLFIDESQDLAGYDLELVELLLRSSVEVFLVADHRQATFSTHSAAKNRKYSGANIVLKFEEWESGELCEIEHHNFSYRCVQKICDFADQFHPDASNTESRNYNQTYHDGVFAVRASDVAQYVATYNPQPLRYSRKTSCPHGKPINFGSSKGMTFERTLIYPHGPLKKFLETGELKHAGKEIEKIYVAVTRARQSVAFVIDDESEVVGVEIFGP